MNNNGKSKAIRLAERCGIDRWELEECVGDAYVDNLAIVKWALEAEFGLEKERVEELCLDLVGIRLV